MRVVSAATLHSPLDLQAVQRRTTVVLSWSQVLGSAGLTSGITMGGLIAKDLLGGATLAGAATASLTLGTAVASARLSELMYRRGRRPGLAVGYVLGSVGAVVSIMSAQLRWFPMLLVGSVLLGCGQSSNLLSRYAAADLAEPARRARAISRMVFMSTFGAVAGPALVGVGGSLGRLVGIEQRAGPYLFSIAFFVIAAVIVTTQLRPDPLVLAGGVRPGRSARRLDVVAPLRIVARSNAGRLALGTMATSQAVMVAVMTMTPLHMEDHDHSVQLIGWVLAVHIAGMYALAPIVGRLNDRFGGPPMIAVGAMVLVAATVVTALAGAVPGLLFAGLFLLGVGWSFGLISGSSLLSGAVPLEQRTRVQGAADLCMSLCGGIAGLASGFVAHSIGFRSLAIAGTIAASVLLVAAMAARAALVSGRAPRVQHP